MQKKNFFICVESLEKSTITLYHPIENRSRKYQRTLFIRVFSRKSSFPSKFNSINAERSSAWKNVQRLSNVSHL